MERYFIEKLKLSYDYSDIGSYWERGNQNEIDIIAINEEEKSMLIAEVKRNAEKISIPKLQAKAEKLLTKHPDYTVVFQGYSLEDM